MSKRETEVAGCLVILFALVFILFAWAGFIFLFGWLIWLVYGAVAPVDWPVIDFWPAVGVAVLLQLFIVPVFRR